MWVVGTRASFLLHDEKKKRNEWPSSDIFGQKEVQFFFSKI